MEPLDTDLDYVVHERRPRAVKRDTRFNWMLLFPVLGVLWVLYLAGAIIFQWSASGIVNTVMTLMVVLFFVFVGLLFWAMSPNARER